MNNNWGFDPDAESAKISEQIKRERDEEYRKFKLMMKRYLKENK